MNLEYKRLIKETRNDIRIYKITFAILSIIILTVLLTGIILTKTNVISETALYYITLGVVSSFTCTVQTFLTNIQRSNNRMFDLQQNEIEELERKLLEKDNLVETDRVVTKEVIVTGNGINFK